MILENKTDFFPFFGRCFFSANFKKAVLSIRRCRSCGWGCKSLRIIQQTPGAYPEPQTTVYEGIPFIWGFGDVWGMLQGYVGVLSEKGKGCVSEVCQFHPTSMKKDGTISRAGLTFYRDEPSKK